MKARTYTQTYLHCPHCGENGHRVDHLPRPASFGPWYCDSCGGSFRGRVLADESIDVELLDDMKVETLDLLCLPPQEKPVYFVIRGMGFRKLGELTALSNKGFFYESHSCPTNWLRDIERLVIEDDDDPHGLLLHVRSIEMASATMQPIDGSEPDVFATFPEIAREVVPKGGEW